MKRILALLVVPSLLAIPMVVGAGTQRAATPVLANAVPIPVPTCAPGSKGCCPKAYHGPNCGKDGTTTLFAVEGTPVKLTATRTKQTARTQMAMYKVYAPHLQKHGFAFRVLAFGPLPSLRLRVKGWLYKFVPATNQWNRIRAITSSGVYEAVLG
jgi:hypothetical protein